MKKILDGVRRFQTDVFPKHKELFKSLATDGQKPSTLFITCADSRIYPGLITQTEPGELFICRNAGNIVPPHTGTTGGITASIEYAVGGLGVQDIIVCGHTGCGAMAAATDPAALERFPHVKNWLTHSSAAVQIVEDLMRDADPAVRFQALIEQNVLAQLVHLRTHPYVATALASGRVKLHGWVYSIEDGEVSIYDEAEKKFLPLSKTAAEEADELTLTAAKTKRKSA